MKVYTTGIWPDDFTKAVMISIPKKATPVKCADYRTIILISHASKILLKTINNRLQSKADMFIGKTQFSLRKRCGTRKAIGVHELFVNAAWNMEMKSPSVLLILKRFFI